MSPVYDLRPALACSCEGIDSFHSHRDFLLGFCVPLVGTADRRLGRPAGVSGFRPVACCPEDAWLYAKLREHPWHSDLGHTGHFGGHFSCCATDHLRCCVVPLVAAPRPAAEPAPAPAVPQAAGGGPAADRPAEGVLASYRGPAPATAVPARRHVTVPEPESLPDLGGRDDRDTTVMPGYPGRRQ